MSRSQKLREKNHHESASAVQTGPTSVRNKCKGEAASIRGRDEAAKGAHVLMAMKVDYNWRWYPS
jgi:hypothetical protein